MAEISEDGVTYQPQDAIQNSIRTTTLFGGAGFAASAIQIALTRQNVGGLAVLTRAGGIIGIMGTGTANPFSLYVADIREAVAGGAYGFTRSAAANLREKNDHLNTAIGGFFAGAIPGLASEPLIH